MPFEDFQEKLEPFFTADQIVSLNDYGIECAIDTYNDTGFRYGAEEVRNAGRYYICATFLLDAECKADIDNVLEEPMAEDKYDALLEQFDIEW